MVARVLRRVAWITTLALCAVVAAARAEDWYRGVVSIGGRPYFHRVQRLHDLTPFGDADAVVQVSGGCTAVSFMHATEAGWTPYVRAFGPWGTPSYPAVSLMEEGQHDAVFLWCSTDAQRILAVWRSGDANRTTRLSEVTKAGAYDGSPIEIRVTAADRYNGSPFVQISAAGVAIAVVEGPTSGNGYGITNVRLFDLAGAPQTSWTSFGGPFNSTTAEDLLRTLDGGALVGTSGQFRRSVFRIEPEGALGAETILAESPAPLGYVRLFPTETGAVVSHEGASTANVFTLNQQGAILGPPVVLTGSGPVAVNPQGKIVSARSIGAAPPSVQLYESDGTPIGGRVPVAGPTPPVNAQYGVVLRRVAYDESGAVWTVFEGHGGGSTLNYLALLKPITHGDLDGDGVLTNFDIDPFVLALVDPAGYQAAYDLPADALGDFDGDGRLTNFDIDPFVNALLSAP